MDPQKDEDAGKLFDELLDLAVRSIDEINVTFVE